jgi:hypothetical protein
MNIPKKILNFVRMQKLLPIIALEQYIEILCSSERFKDEKRLLKYEYQVFSQSGEDGIIYEIFNRIGATNKFFVEFGGNDGSINNSTNLLFNGWSGLWIEADKNLIIKAKTTFKKFIEDNKLKIDHNFVTPENIETIFNKYNIPADLDFLSIDIDNNDYYIWEAVKSYKPRVVVIEYNASLGPHNAMVIPYVEGKFDITNYFGASLKALEQLGLKKGYSLVGCTSSGSNAFLYVLI